MKQRILIVIILSTHFSYGQTKIFDGYDFENENYALVFLNVELVEEEIAVEESLETVDKSNPIEYIDNRHHYLIDSKLHLSSIKNSWEGKPVDYRYMCWYNYFIYLLKDGEVISEMRTNFECKELLVDKVPYEFDSTLVTSLLSQAEKISKIDVTYESIDEGRSHYKQSIRNPDLLMVNYYRPSWIDYNGQFEVQFLDYDKTGNIERRISDLIEAAGLVNFKLSWASSGYGHKDEPNDYWYRVFSNEQPETLSGLKVREDWIKFNGPFKATYIKRDSPIRH